MYKMVFQNSKTALAFAAMTVFGAVSMVGTSEESGVVTQAADLIAAQRQSIASDASAFAESQSGGDMKVKSTPPSVFGDYIPPDQTVAKQAVAVAPKGPQSAGNSLMTAPLAPGAIMLDSGEVGYPVITEREMTITPE